MSSLAPQPRPATPPQYFRLSSDPERRHHGPTLLRLGATWTPLHELAPQPRRPRPAVFENARWARVPVWTNRTSWLLHARFAIRSTRGAELRRAYGGLSISTFMDIMRTDARTADGTTGRNVYTSHETVSHRTGHSTQAVRRARNIAERLGLSVTVDRGRYLPRRERFLAGRAHTHYQCRKASTRALTMSRPAAVYTASIQATTATAAGIGHLPRSGSVKRSSSLKRTYQARERARSGKKQLRKPLPAAASRKLAARLGQHVQVLGRHGHLNALALVLERHLGDDLPRWTPRDLLSRMDQILKDRDLRRPETLHSPAGWVSWLLVQAPLDTPQRDQQVQAHREQAIQATLAAKQRLDTARSPEVLAVRAAGIAQLRAALTKAQTASNPESVGGNE